MRVFVLGAGASKAYDQSPSGQRMPVARDFFETFLKLKASESPWVLLGGVMAYLMETREVHDLYEYLRSGLDIEDLHSDPPSFQWTPMLAFRSWRGVSDECSTPGVSGIVQAGGR